MDDHRIVGVAWGCVELNGNRTKHDFFFIINVHGHTKTGGFVGHNVFTAVRFT